MPSSGWQRREASVNVRAMSTQRPELPASIDATAELLAAHDYVADRQLATSAFLALRLQRPLFLEGEPGTGKTEIAKVLAAALSRRQPSPD